jgi:hypothetical protein
VSGLPRGARVAVPDPFREARTAVAVENWLYSMDRYFDIVPMNSTQQVALAVNLLQDDANLRWPQFIARTREEQHLIQKNVTSADQSGLPLLPQVGTDKRKRRLRLADIAKLDQG